MGNVFRQPRDQTETTATYEKAPASYRARVDADPTDWEGWANLGQGYNILGQFYWEFDRVGDAVEPFRAAAQAYREAVRLAPQVPRALNYLAWFLASCPDDRFRDPAESIRLAERTLLITPVAGGIWNTLGVAHYRAGHLDECLAALDRSMELSGGDGIAWFFMAMALASKGECEPARAFYVRAVDWMDRQGALDGELQRLRAEAAALLGLKEDPAAPQGKEERPPSPEGNPVLVGQARSKSDA
jgi:tetratricopeptide (TPR) repeat protein